jgi:hypothetical protein
VWLDFQGEIFLFQPRKRPTIPPSPIKSLTSGFSFFSFGNYTYKFVNSFNELLLLLLDNGDSDDTYCCIFIEHISGEYLERTRKDLEQRLFERERECLWLILERALVVRESR